MKERKPTLKQIKEARRLGIELTGDETASDVWRLTNNKRKMMLAEKYKELGLNPEEYSTHAEMRETVSKLLSLQKSGKFALNRFLGNTVEFRGERGVVTGWGMGGLIIKFDSGKTRGGYNPKDVKIIGKKK